MSVVARVGDMGGLVVGVESDDDRGSGGERHRVTFANGYTASVVRGPYSYGGREGLWEVAVLVNGRLDYSTPVTSDVLGRLHSEEVAEVMAQIATLPAVTP